MNSEEKESTILRFVKEEEEKDEDWAIGDESDNGWRSVKRRKVGMVEDVEEEEEEVEEAVVEVEEEDEWE